MVRLLDRGRRTDAEMWALQTWGELALGLAAPQASHAVGNDYSNQTLCWDLVRETVASGQKGLPSVWGIGLNSFLVVVGLTVHDRFSLMVCRWKCWISYREFRHS